METKTMLVKKILYYTFGIVPIVAGLDKFTNILADWSQYVAPGMQEMLPFEVSTFMALVGIIEILAGIVVLLRPAIGAYIVMAWLVAIALSLIFSGAYLDVAVRDLVMALGAFSLAQLTNDSSS